MENWKWRKKPVVIEAFQVPSRETKNQAVALPSWAFQALADKTLELDHSKFTVAVKTLEGVMAAAEGDWIIRGIKGELYPCKDEIFKATYDRVTE